MVTPANANLDLKEEEAINCVSVSTNGLFSLSNFTSNLMHGEVFAAIIAYRHQITITYVLMNVVALVFMLS